MGKKIAFIADSLENIQKFQDVLRMVDAEVIAGSSIMMKSILSDDPNIDLVIIESNKDPNYLLAEVANTLNEEDDASLLAIVPNDKLAGLTLPTKISSDFVAYSASKEECIARIGMLLSPGSEASASDFIKVGNMTINLATYQVKVNNEPLDLTYLEYALLSFLVTHPSRTYSRETLLRRVWGFDYYGGSRTVDVHVRRIRAKLGPELAQHLETVRGVGYLWNI